MHYCIQDLLMLCKYGIIAVIEYVFKETDLSFVFISGCLRLSFYRHFGAKRGRNICLNRLNGEPMVCNIKNIKTKGLVKNDYEKSPSNH